MLWWKRRCPYRSVLKESMKRRAVLILCAVCLMSAQRVSAAEAWRVYKSRHFLVFYDQAPEDFIRSTAEYAEGYYDRIAQELGFMRFDFWLWDNRARIYIHNSALEYQYATGNPSWSGGAASASDKVIHTYVHAENFVHTILPHEMGHIIFREFVGAYNPAVPLWLEEGVASYQEKAKYAGARSAVKQAQLGGRQIDLYQLSSAGSLFLLDEHSAYLFYAQAFTIVDFLIQEYGADRFVYFCQNLRDKQNMDRALSSAYPLNGLAGLQEAWRKWIKK